MDAALSMDFILSNVIGFTLSNKNYLSLQLVSKTWKSMVETLKPRVIVQIENVIGGNGIASEQDRARLLFLALKELFLDRNSNMYRLDSKENGWPTLHPQYHVTLKQFARLQCTTEHLAAVCRKSMHVLSAHTVHQFWKAMQTQCHDKALKSIIHMWKRWKAVILLTGSIIGHEHDGLANRGKEPSVYVSSTMHSEISGTKQSRTRH